ncbi:MAG: hypothetical protein J7L62_01285 [Candidatus Aminicenantes bacterium]|nr:hypothetical protein [Candidatus Aminicenantes bacterium]
MRKIAVLMAILFFSVSIVAADINRDVAMFGSIFSTAINASGRARFQVSPFVVDGYGVFYFVHSPATELARKLIRVKVLRKMGEGVKERMEGMKGMTEEEKKELEERIRELKEKMKERMEKKEKISKQRILEGIKKAIITSAEYGNVLKNVPDNYWLCFVFQSPKKIGNVYLPGLVVKVKVKDVKKYAQGKIKPEDFAKRIMIPPIPEEPEASPPPFPMPE